MKRALIALGGNEPSLSGAPEVTLRAALDAMNERGLRVERVSRFFATPAFPAGSGPEFVNAAAAIITSLPPATLLSVLHDIERAFGRDRSTRWSARTLDLDLLAVEDCVHPDVATVESWIALPLEEQMRRAPDGLILPHPRLAEREFVLIPLADVAPEWRHPLSGKSVSEMVAALDAGARAEVKPL